MKLLYLIVIIFMFCGSTCDEFEPTPGYLQEPTIILNFADGNTDSYLAFSGSVNKPKKRVKNNDLLGIDMNANSTKYWILRSGRQDSFTVNYKLKTFFKYEKTWIDFDTIYLSQSSFKRAYLGHSSIDSLNQNLWHEAIIIIWE